MGKRRSASWMYMSRLAAQKEWAFMKVVIIFIMFFKLSDYLDRFSMNTGFLFPSP
jgi:hypothetical protein